ncbi:hypothetical protein HPB50_008129 [Hyalomma asiaticum]|uniref:Uncharacterized protein n=1 Tax=Hyalomma asiaticum TaxID=266040 RepID=A0ACB7T3D6_HYAAI|nr:hypothetical protein HPB50_008129 [Hyalomma asiaticum]
MSDQEACIANLVKFISVQSGHNSVVCYGGRQLRGLSSELPAQYQGLSSIVQHTSVLNYVLESLTPSQNLRRRGPGTGQVSRLNQYYNRMVITSPRDTSMAGRGRTVMKERAEVARSFRLVSVENEKRT